MFEQYKFDPSLYENIKQAYQNGKKVKMIVWEWEYDEQAKSSYKKEISSKEIPDLSSFNADVWDRFALFAKEYVYTILFGVAGLEGRNPERPKQVFYDGIIFYYIRQEFKDCMENESVERFLSCLTHFGYEHVDFVVMDS